MIRHKMITQTIISFPKKHLLFRQKFCPHFRLADFAVKRNVQKFIENFGGHVARIPTTLHEVVNRQDVLDTYAEQTFLSWRILIAMFESGRQLIKHLPTMILSCFSFLGAVSNLLITSNHRPECDRNGRILRKTLDKRHSGHHFFRHI